MNISVGLLFTACQSVPDPSISFILWNKLIRTLKCAYDKLVPPHSHNYTRTVIPKEMMHVMKARSVCETASVLVRSRKLPCIEEIRKLGLLISALVCEIKSID